jgi:hypothetical protein
MGEQERVAGLRGSLLANREINQSECDQGVCSEEPGTAYAYSSKRS